ncbi:MAG: hypothetical protein WCK91_03310, partial [bacterium]
PKHTGFIAQEVEQVFPDLVFTDATTHLKSLNYMGLIPYTVEAVKDMNIKLNSLAEADIQTDSFASVFWNNVFTKVSRYLSDAANNLTDVFAGTFHAKDKLCINATCVTEAQLQTLLQNSQPAQSSGGYSPAPDPSPTPAPDPTPVIPPADTSTVPPVFDPTPTSVPSSDTPTTPSI